MAARNVNRVVLSGNLTRDPDSRTTPKGATVVELGLAVNGSEKRGDEWEDRADFFDVIVFGAIGQACADHLSKGSAVVVEGRLRQDRWEDRDTGKSRSKVKVIANQVQFVGGGGNRSQSDFEPPASDGGAYAGASSDGGQYS